jgi:hypothetical protein
MARGGNVKELSFDNSNLYFYGFGRDTNGNTIVKVGFPNQKAFSIQINNPQFRNTYSLKSNKVSEISESDLNKIEKEVVAYVKSFGSAKQKSTLKVYSGFKMAQGGGVGITKNLDKIKNNIGETIYNHISKLNKTQLENQLKELRQELEIPTTTERYSKLKDEEFLILYRLERTSEFNYAKGGSMGWKHKMGKK